MTYKISLRRSLAALKIPTCIQSYQIFLCKETLWHYSGRISAGQIPPFPDAQQTVPRDCNKAVNEKLKVVMTNVCCWCDVFSLSCVYHITPTSSLRLSTVQCRSQRFPASASSQVLSISLHTTVITLLSV